eukprot:TRINITY_DN777975_c0_g1_i1.p1 TRINITY_DN777975_c0_g1~~TRINITY_DN777975_c0_g1_i1.p1  ORF type:complete len:123 (-),score=39.93 TRINITY_DN777975_c0_g1_i1:120-488(-)
MNPLLMQQQMRNMQNNPLMMQQMLNMQQMMLQQQLRMQGMQSNPAAAQQMMLSLQQTMMGMGDGDNKSKGVVPDPEVANIYDKKNALKSLDFINPSLLRSDAEKVKEIVKAEAIDQDKIVDF